MRVVFLGTAGSVPTPYRSLPSIVIMRKGELLMFDCGEGVQRQMITAKLGFQRKTKIFVTHMHGDHLLGLPGLIQTMALLKREKKVDVYGPPGIQSFMDGVQLSVPHSLPFPLNIVEVKGEGVVCEEEEYSVEAAQTSHVVPSFAYALAEKPRPGKFFPEKARKYGVPEGPLWAKLQNGSSVRLPDGSLVKPAMVMGPLRRGRKVVYTGDTRPSGKIVALSIDADLLIHDSTFSSDLREKACEDGHSTPRQAAEVAKKANVKRLVLTHISARYGDPQQLLEEAKEVFRRVEVAEDFLEIRIPH